MDTYHLKGEYTVTRIDRATGRVVGVERARNAITLDGKNELIKLILGSGGQAFDAAHATLTLKDAAGVVTKTFAGITDPDDAAYPKVSTVAPIATWQWSDISVDQYDTTQAEFGNGTVVFSTVNPTSWTPKLKPRTENWIYQYQLTIDGGFVQPYQGGGVNPTMPYKGALDWPARMIGTSPDPWDETNTRIRISRTMPTELSGEPAWVGGYGNCIEPPTHDLVNAKLSWLFQSSVQGQWAFLEILKLVGSTITPLVGVQDSFNNSSDFVFYTATITFT